METIAERLTAAMRARETNPNALSGTTGIDQSTIYRISKGTIQRPKAEHLSTLAATLNISLVWLQTGFGASGLTGESAQFAPSNVGNSLHSKVLGKYPVMTWQDASNRQDGSTIASVPGALLKIEPSHYVKAGQRAFWLTVIGDPMTAKSGPSFPDGTLILVDPEVPFAPGKFVIAIDATNKKAMFKQLATDGANWFLSSLNDKYPLIAIDSPEACVIAVCVEHKPPGGPM